MQLNKTSQTRMVIFFLSLSGLLFIVHLLYELNKPTADSHKVVLLFSLGSLFIAVILSSYCDLRLELPYLFVTSVFRVRKIALTDLEIYDIKIQRGPVFSLTTKKRIITAAYTKENYKVLQKLVRLSNEKHITLDKLERLVKYSISSLK